MIKAEPAVTGLAKSPPITAPPENAPFGSVSLAKGQTNRDEHAVQPEAATASPAERRGEVPPPEANGFARDNPGGRDATLPRMAPSAAPQLPRSPAPTAHSNGDARRTLHLSLGTNPPGNGGAHPVEPAAAEQRHNLANVSQPTQLQTGEERRASADRGAPHGSAEPDRGGNGAAGTGFAEARPTAYYGPVQQTGNDGARRKDGAGPFIDKELRARVDGDIAAFLTAFDGALVEDTQESRSALREATDRLLRAGARTRIELERLEARLPLPPRDGNGRGEAAWRHR